MTETLLAFSRTRRELGIIVLLAGMLLPGAAMAQELKFPQIITVHYSAKEPNAGGQFVICERDKIW
jgi:hypothetical protein